MENTWKNHRLYNEYSSLRNDDASFAELWGDTEYDFLEWAMNYEIDADWGTKWTA